MYGLLRESDQLVEDLDVSLAQLDIGEAAVVGERPIGMADGKVLLDHARAPLAAKAFPDLRL